MKIPTSVLIFVLCFGMSINAQETFKTMFYNLLNYPLQEPASRIQELDYVLNQYQPDLFMVCELNNSDGATNILNVLQQMNPNYAMANFVLNTSDDAFGDSNDLQNLIFFDSTKFILESQDEVTTIYRDFNRYKLKLNTTDQLTNPVYLEVFVCHLKATQEDQAERLQMVNDFESYLNDPSNNFSASSYVMLAGDFNVYTSAEPAFQELIDPTNTVTFIDPANRIGSWHNNVSFVDVFTQSTRTSSGLGGAPGGFDDRFDFIMTSTNMQSAAELSYVPGSYKVYGNNGNSDCYNQEINSSDCSGAEFDFDLRDALYTFSDHLPVTLHLQTNQTLDLEEEYLTNSISFIGSNIISDQLRINVNNNLIQVNYLDIYNTLGQKIKRIALFGSNIITEDISYLGNGVYYIILENQVFKPLKFIKSH